jgi:hypothetical protein
MKRREFITLLGGVHAEALTGTGPTISQGVTDVPKDSDRNRRISAR